MKIEDFQTSVTSAPDLKPINLDPKENIINKKHIRKLLKNIAEASIDSIQNNLRDAYHEEAELNGFHPINEIKGVDSIQKKLWEPLLKSFPDLERRDNLIIGGSFQDKVFVSCISHLTGTFVKPWLNVPATKKTIHLRLCEAHQLKEKKIIKSYILIDTVDFIRQAGFWPINPPLGIEEMWPGPITSDGTTYENLDGNLSLASLEQALTMQRSLNIKPETEPEITIDEIKEKLINHPQKDFWHSKMMWYGPCGIGTSRGLSGFVDHHQLPFRLTFKERDYWKIGHYIEIGDGNYSMTGGWHSIQCIHGSKDWLGYDATNKKITMRVMDFYLHHEGLIRENWVPIDIAHILSQIDIDIFKLIHKK